MQQSYRREAEMQSDPVPLCNITQTENESTAHYFGLSPGYPQARIQASGQTDWDVDFNDLER